MSSAADYNFDVIADPAAKPAPLLCETYQAKSPVKTKRLLLIGSAGYIGSYLLPYLRKAGYDVDTCDRSGRDVPTWPCCHSQIPFSEIRQYDAVLWFAGVASVAAAITDPQEALRQNVLLLAALRQRMRPGARLIYASSASVYSEPLEAAEDHPEWSIAPYRATEETPVGPGHNAYDKSKILMDKITTEFFADTDTVALRMGTLAGWSPRLRRETLFNAMCLAALEKSKIRVSNPMAWRSILFLSDLADTIKVLLEAEQVPLLLNVGSVSGPILEFGKRIADYHWVKLKIIRGSMTYSFRMDSAKMWNLLNDRALPSSILGQCGDFQDAFRLHEKETRQ